MSFFKKPKATMFQHLTYDNYYLKKQCNDMQQMITTLQNNISDLNDFIISHYDLSLNVLENIRIITCDCSDNVIACVHSDLSGNFSKCSDLSGNLLPCVINPDLQIKRSTKTHISDASRCFPYGYPYYGYPYYGYPYYGYPYLSSDDYYYDRNIEIKDPQPIMHPRPNVPPLPNMNHANEQPPVNKIHSIHPFPRNYLSNSTPGTHIHIHH